MDVDKLTFLIKRIPPWLRSTGSYNDIVIYTQVSLVRNLKKYMFVHKLSFEEKKHLSMEVIEGIGEILDKDSFYIIDLAELDKLDNKLLRSLYERQIIKKESLNDFLGKKVMFYVDESLYVIINEDEHFKIKIRVSGFNFDFLYKKLIEICKSLSFVFEFAFDSKYGFLSAYPQNVGLGIFFEVLTYIPALVVTRKIDDILKDFRKKGLYPRGFYEGNRAAIRGDLVYFYTYSGLGKSEEELSHEFKVSIEKLIDEERKTRREIYEKIPLIIEDRVYKSLGMLREAKLLNMLETVEILGGVRMGKIFDIDYDLPSLQILNELLLFTQPSHLSIITQKDLKDIYLEDSVRAEFVKDKLGV